MQLHSKPKQPVFPRPDSTLELCLPSPCEAGSRERNTGREGSHVLAISGVRAVAALIDRAGQPSGKLTGAREIATAGQIPMPFLWKILRHLDPNTWLGPPRRRLSRPTPGGGKNLGVEIEGMLEQTTRTELARDSRKSRRRRWGRFLDRRRLLRAPDHAFSKPRHCDTQPRNEGAKSGHSMGRTGRILSRRGHQDCLPWRWRPGRAVGRERNVIRVIPVDNSSVPGCGVYRVLCWYRG